MSDQPNDEAQPPRRGDFAASTDKNPFGQDLVTVRPNGALVSVEQQRAIAEVQARMIVARSNPRDMRRCMDLILNDCTRPTLAQSAIYDYARGGSQISGPTIKLAESIARRWGNIASGIKEISRENGFSECVAYAWDLETGYYDERQFQVRHWRDTRSGGYLLKDERDIYELIANMGQRRKRAVILTVIPGDVVEAAVAACEETLHATADNSPESLKKIVDVFATYNVTREMIEKRCQCKLEAIRPAQIVQLRKVFNSLRDGMSGPQDWFEGGPWGAIENRHAASPPTSQRKAPAKAAGAPADDKPAAPRKAPAKKAADADGPPDDGRWGPQDGQPPVDKEATEGPGVASGSAPSSADGEGERLRADPSPEPFDAWLLDEIGAPATTEPDDDPIMFVGNFALLLRSKPDQFERLIQENADNLEAVRRSGNNVAIDALEVALEPQGEPEEQGSPGAIVIELKMERGKPMEDAYRKAFDEEVKSLTVANFADFVELNRPNLVKVRRSYNGLLIKSLDLKAKELGLGMSPDVRRSLQPLEAPAAAPATAAAPTADEDLITAQNRVRDINSISTLDELRAFNKGPVISNFIKRMQAIDPQRTDLLRLVQAAFLAKQESLGGGSRPPE